MIDLSFMLEKKKRCNALFIILAKIGFFLSHPQIRLQYAYCFELRLVTSDAPLSPHLKSFVIDNLCMESNGLTFHFLSSAQGGTYPIIPAKKFEMTCVILDFISLGIKLRWPSREDVNLLIQFQKPAHVLHVYHDIYKFRTLTVITSLPT